MKIPFAIDFLFKQFVLNRIALFATNMPDLSNAAGDLGGGGSPPAGEPDIFEDAPTGEEPAGEEPATEEEEPAGEEIAEEPAGEEEEPAGEEPAGEETDEERQVREAAEKAQKDGQQPRPKVQTEEDKKIEAALKESYKNDPKLQQFLKDNPSHRATFFKAAEINKMFPGGLREAEQSKQWATELFKIDKLVYGNGPQDVKSKREFVNLLWNECLDKQGKPTGHFETIAELITSDTLENIAAHLATQPHIAQVIDSKLTPGQVQTAITIVKRAAAILTGRDMPSGQQREGSQRTIPQTADTSKMDPAVRAIYEENQRLKAEQSTRSQSEAAASEATFHKTIYDKYAESLTPDIVAKLPTLPTGRGIIQRWFVSEVLNKVNDALTADEFFEAQLSAAARSGDRGQQHVQQLSDMMKTRALALIPAAADAVKLELMKPNVAPRIPNRPGQQGNIRSGGNERPRREPASGGSPGRLTRGSGRLGQSAGEKRGTPLRSTGEYISDANKILGID